MYDQIWSGIMVSPSLSNWISFIGIYGILAIINTRINNAFSLGKNIQHTINYQTHEQLGSDC